jgi:hypothetical protein
LELVGHPFQAFVAEGCPGDGLPHVYRLQIAAEDAKMSADTSPGIELLKRQLLDARWR